MTNLGTNAAMGVVLTQACSLSVTGTIATATRGTATNVNSFMTWQIPALPAGAGASLTVLAQAAQTGTLVARSGVRHSANDPKLDNNFSLLAASVGSPSTNEIREIALATRELVFGPVRQQIYASVPTSEPFLGNSVVAIDPVSSHRPGSGARRAQGGTRRAAKRPTGSDGPERPHRF